MRSSPLKNTQNIRKNRSVAVLSVVLLFALYFTPTFPAFTRGTLYFGTLITLAVLVFFSSLIVIAKNRLPANVLSSAMIVFISFMGLTVASLVLDAERAVFSDIIEITKPIAALLSFLAMYQAFNNTNEIRSYYVKPLMFVFLAVAFLGLLEAYGGLSTITHILYTRPRPILEGKAVSPFGITYFYATFMLIGASFFMFLFLKSSKLASIGFCLCVTAILSSQSRTVFLALLTFLILLFTFYVFYPRMPGKNKLSFMALAVALLIFIIIVYYWEAIIGSFGYLASGLSALMTSGVNPDAASGSANIRASQVVWSMENVRLLGILGTGIGKGYSPLLESFYALYIYRYGYLGIALYVMIAFWGLILSYRCARMANENNEAFLFAFFMAFHFFILTLPVTSLSSVITDQYIFMLFYYGGLGLMVRYQSLQKVKRNLLSG